MKCIFYFAFKPEVAEDLVCGKADNRIYEDMLSSFNVVFEPNIPINNVSNINLLCSIKPMVSIIIPVRNNWIYTYNCLCSIANSFIKTEYEVIVVDNASTDDTMHMLGKIQNVITVRHTENLGFVDACNAGAKSSRGSTLLFLNNDAIITGDSVDKMLGLLFSNNAIGVVGAKLIYPDGRLQEAGGIVWNDPVNIAWNYGKYDSPGNWQYEYVKEVDYCSGACLLIKRELFFKVGMFDQSLSPAYFEDTDLAFSARKEGFKVVYQPKALILHFEGVTAGIDVTKGFKKYQAINQKYFYHKWKQVLQTDNFNCGEHVFLARDRTRNKKIMLYVDHQVPTFDKDAGSLITYEYLKVFLTMDYKIVFWPENLEKIEPYTSDLQQLGIEVVYGYGSLKTYLNRYGKYFDVVFLSRPFQANKYLQQARAYSNAKIFYVAHDLHYLREMRRGEIENNSKLIKYANRLKGVELNIMQRSDRTLVFSSVEKTIIENENVGAHVLLMPWIQKVHNTNTKFEEREGLMFLGGFVHKPNQDGLLWFVRNIFPIIKKEVKDIKLIVIGSSPTKEVIELAREDIVIKGYVPEITPYFQSTRVFVAPLRYGAGVKGKIIEAMSHGLPVVTTPIGAEGIDLVNKENGMIAGSAEEFARYVINLYNSKEFWTKLSANSYQYVLKNNSPEYAKGIFEKYFKGLHE